MKFLGGSPILGGSPLLRCLPNKKSPKGERGIWVHFHRVSFPVAVDKEPKRERKSWILEREREKERWQAYHYLVWPSLQSWEILFPLVSLLLLLLQFLLLLVLLLQVSRGHSASPLASHTMCSPKVNEVFKLFSFSLWNCILSIFFLNVRFFSSLTTIPQYRKSRKKN